MSSVVTYPHPGFIPASADYTVSAGGEEQFVYTARASAMPVDQIFRGKTRPEAESEIVSFVTFACGGPVELTVRLSFEIFTAKVRPGSKNIRVSADLSTDTAVFTIPGPGHYTLETNGPHKALMIFANPLEEDRPDPLDPNVIYFGPGVHSPGVIRLHDGQTVFLDAGAYVFGAIQAEGAKHIRAAGRGILNACNIPRVGNEGRDTVMAFQFIGCEDVTAQDFILLDPPAWGQCFRNCADVRVENTKQISWRYNSDGVSPTNCRNVHISRCFVRSFDDSLIASCGPDPAGYFLCEDCVVWNDWGRALEVFGAQGNVVFRNIDIVHFLFIACDVQCMGPNHIRGVTFENIRVEEPLDPHDEPRLMEIFVRKQCWGGGRRKPLGRVSDVCFRGIRYTGRTQVPCRFVPFSRESGADGIRLEHVTVNGERMTEKGLPMAPIVCNDFVSGLTVDGVSADGAAIRHESAEETCSSYLIGNGAFIVSSDPTNPDDDTKPPED